MEENTQILKLRVLLCLLKADGANGTVTGISRTLGKEKYVISRIMAGLEGEGLIDRTNPRKPCLTEAGRRAARRYDARLEVSMNHLLYEGVDPDSARQDALVWARFCTEGTMDVVRSSESRFRLKYALRDKRRFSGAVVCRLLQAGTYQIPYVLYREQVIDGHNISPANEGFAHPCTLRVENGVGTVHLRCVNIAGPTGGEETPGKVTGLRYFSNGWFVDAESGGDLFSFPAEALTFLNFGTGVGQILHGSVGLQLLCPGEREPVQVIFTMMI